MQISFKKKKFNFRKPVLSIQTKMFFEINDEEKKLFEDIQFKRRVVFVDDDDLISIEFKSQEKKNLM